MTISKKYGTAVIWVGTIDARKSLKILLDVLNKVKGTVCFHLDIVGDGPLRQALMAYAKNCKIETDITWHGQCSRTKVFDLFQKSHVHIITSCIEGNPTVIWEAMSFGVPTISLDHSGMHDILCEQCGIRIPVYNYDQIITDLGMTICSLGNHPEKVKKLSEGVLKCAQQYTWDKRRAFFNRQYDIAITHYRIKHPD